jgi:glycine/D-amino acid oxidase-like deaminating enzyme
MDLRSHSPYWLLRHGIINVFPSLNKSFTTEVVIIGAGISGSLTAWYLCKAGFKVAIVDRRHVGMGSTVASTSLLQYEIDTPLNKLIEKIGKENAVNSYLLARDAIYNLGSICEELGDEDVFQYKPSFQFASYKKDVKDLRNEFSLRKKIGLSVEWLEQKEVQEKFGIKKPAGILSKDGADADAYKITHRLLKKCEGLGLKVYDHTEIVKIVHRKKNIELVTARNKKINARWLVIACGYESQRYISKKIELLRSTFAIASEPMQQKNFWYKNAIIWETARPYLYMRTTEDCRIILGGKDVDFSDPKRRDKLLNSKKTALEKTFCKLFPSIPFKTDFSWAGVFGTTKDGLPYIGSLRERPNTFFALGFGGNGILFSVIAAEMIRDALTRKRNPCKKIFSFDR